MCAPAHVFRGCQLPLPARCLDRILTCRRNHAPRRLPLCSFDYILDQQAYVAVDAGKEANPEVIQAFKSHPVHKVGESWVWCGCAGTVLGGRIAISWNHNCALRGWEGMPHVMAQEAHRPLLAYPSG